MRTGAAAMNRQDRSRSTVRYAVRWDSENRRCNWLTENNLYRQAHVNSLASLGCGRAVVWTV